MTINIYEAVYRTEQGKELYTKTWYAPTWEHAYRMAEIYRNVTLHEAFDFIFHSISGFVMQFSLLNAFNK